MSAIRFALATQRSLRQTLEASIEDANRRAHALRLDADESLAQLDVSDVVDGEASDPSAVHRGEALALAVANDHVLAETRAALDRLDAGTYGTCERCASPIPIARLRAIPHTRWCVDCSHELGGSGRVLAFSGS